MKQVTSPRPIGTSRFPFLWFRGKPFSESEPQDLAGKAGSRTLFSAVIELGRMKPWNRCKSSCDHERKVSLRMESTQRKQNQEMYRKRETRS